MEASKLGVSSAEEAHKAGVQTNDPDKNKSRNIEDLVVGFTGENTATPSDLLI